MGSNSRFQEIVEVIGYDRAAELTKAIGGITLWIPRGTVPLELKEILGEVEAAKLSKHFEGGRLAIPKADFIARKLRNEQICLAFYQGVTIRALALQHRLNERMIGTILEQERNERSSERAVTDSDRPTG